MLDGHVREARNHIVQLIGELVLTLTIILPRHISFQQTHHDPIFITGKMLGLEVQSVSECSILKMILYLFFPPRQGFFV